MLQAILGIINPKNTGWHRVNVILNVRLIDGTEAHGGLWARKVNGYRQYRRMTDDEEIDFFVDRW